jgi:hypothetical protein
MARLKVKQISDIQGYVQNLIDTDSDQNAGLIDALEASVDSLEALAGGSITADLTASVDSLEVVDTNQSTSIANNASSIANNASSIATNATGIAQNVKDISDLQTQADNNDDDNLALTASVDSLELLAGGSIVADLAASVLDNDTRVDAILNGSTADLDQFAEVIAYVNSVDTVGDLDLTNALAVVNASIDSLEGVDTAISNALSTEILTTGGEISDLQDSVDALQAADVVIDASIDSLELIAIDSFAAGLRIHQMGTVTASAADGGIFTVGTAVDGSADADCVVYVNGKGEQMKMADNSNGWTLAADGVTFTLSGIGYEVNGEDEVYVIAPYRGDAETTGTGGGEDYEDFFNAREQKRGE